MNAADIASNAALRNYSISSPRQYADPLTEFIAPEVATTKRLRKVSVFDDKHRFSIPDTKRARGGDGAWLSQIGSQEQLNLEDHGLNETIDISDIEETDDVIDLVQESMDDIGEIGQLSRAKEASTKFKDATGAAQNVDFSDDAVKGLKLIEQAVYDLMLANGVFDPARIGILFGPTAKIRFSANKEVASRKTGGGVTIGFNLVADLPEMLSLPVKVKIATFGADENPQGKAKSLKWLIDDEIVLFVRSDRPTRRDPSFMKTFRMSSGWMGIRAWDMPSGRGTNVGIDWVHEIKLTNSNGAKKFRATA